MINDMGWGNMRVFVDRDDEFGERDEMKMKLQRIYDEGFEDGCEYGKREAFEMMRGDFGERNGYSGNSSSGSSSGGSYGNRMEEYGGQDFRERRGVKNTGPYGGEYRRRRNY